MRRTKLPDNAMTGAVSAPAARWRPAFLMVGLGGVAALGQAPFDLWFATVLGLGLAMVCLPGHGSPRSWAWRMWAFGTGYFLVALHWVFEPFLVDAARHAWMAPFAVVLLSGGLALFWTAAGWAARRLGGGLLGLALWLALAEMLRGTVLTGFPWAMPGYVWVSTEMRHWAALFGPYGLTALTFVMPALVASAYCWRRWQAAFAAALLAAAFAAPAFVPRAPVAEPAPDAPVVRLVQPNAPQREKWDPDRAQFYFDRHIALSSGPGAPDLVIWSETSLPMLLNHAEIAFEIMAEASPGVPHLVGVQRRNAQGGYHNSAVLVTDTQVQAIYDKHHLVPFGEYMPLQGLAARVGLRGLADRLGGYTAGPGPQLLDLGFGTALPLICYEVVFPRNLRTAARPGLLIQITNDAWFGQFSGPYQHLAQARMRSTELGLPMLRVANTGVSAVIDARGRVLQQLPMNTHGTLDVRLPPALPPTVYAQIGDAPVWIALVGLIGLGKLITFRLTGRAGRGRRL